MIEYNFKPAMLKERFRKAKEIVQMVKDAFAPEMAENIEYISQANLKEWLSNEREAYAENPAYPLGQRVLIGTFVSQLIHKIENKEKLDS